MPAGAVPWPPTRTAGSRSVPRRRNVTGIAGAARLTFSPSLENTAWQLERSRPRPSAKSALSLDTLQHALAIGRMTARMQLRLVDDSEREIPLEAARACDVKAATPWRTFRSHRSQRHYSGSYWSSTTGGHVIYESRLEQALANPQAIGDGTVGP